MKAYLLIILIGLVAGFIGIIPLLRRKVDKYILLGAFVLCPIRCIIYILPE